MTKLTDISIRNAKAGNRIRKLSDGNGLTLLVYPNGRKYWVYRYRYLGKEKSLSLGIYPEVTLGDEEFSYQLLTIVRPQPTRIALQIRSNRS